MNFNLPADSNMLRREFTFGVATAAFQIEGSNRSDGRGECIWDRFCATPGKVLNGDDGSVACDHYNRLEDDLDMIASLGVDAYRFSVAWPRIEPSPGQWNEAGFAFYQRLIDGLIARNIKPYLTLYHWDLPQYLEDKGGWVNRETAYAFATYAEKIAERFGDQVVSYCTFNEPWCSAFMGYRFGWHAPGRTGARTGYQAAHHLLLAHGLALPKLRQHAPKATHGLVLNFVPGYGATDSAADQTQADLDNMENWYFFSEALFTGHYPAAVVERHPDWAPTVLDGDMELISQPMDYLGINYYTSVKIRATASGREHLPHPEPKTDIGWSITPHALTDLLLELPRRYADLPPMLICENGAADNTEKVAGEVQDTMRCNYYNDHLNAVDAALRQGADVRGYFAWSLMDNFEWAEGYSQRFGIVHVDYRTQERTLKQSAKNWQALLASR